MDPSLQNPGPPDGLPPVVELQPLPDPAGQPITTPEPSPEARPAPGMDVPDNIKRLVSLSFTLLAALLYGAILGGAVVMTLLDSSAEFTGGATRAVQILSGLVGTVVTAGFARARQPNAVTVRPRNHEHALLSKWKIQTKMLGLADVLGLNLHGLTLDSDVTTLEDEPVRAVKINTATWVGIAYFAIYFVVGAGAFALTMLRMNVPEIISNSAWVWLGTIISTSYTFFALNEDPSAG
ncbi:MAG: hypothetical protein GXY52_08400 [Chloroflexi bacterium]|nr:hypothetical protein [Chloroflexota bacterium]